MTGVEQQHPEDRRSAHPVERGEMRSGGRARPVSGGFGGGWRAWLGFGGRGWLDIRHGSTVLLAGGGAVFAVSRLCRSEDGVPGALYDDRVPGVSERYEVLCRLC
ncbi:hypothetical protein GCM10022222_81290 [Amycolatopsis ultiminotia]|uniref:Uncharacterized protein n=1 Tax=Amycolatopsis ultiminotia TaxID=543629 RepID=A0ABP6YJM2_9PSEU